MKRVRLARMIYCAWKKCISEQYFHAQLNSEAALQAWLCTYLHGEIVKHGLPWRIFVEPRMELEHQQRAVLPDLLVCNAHRVIGVIEIKYSPRGEADPSKDLRTLVNLAASSGKDGVSVANERYRGPNRRAKRYAIAEDVLLVWAAVSAIETPDSVMQSMDYVDQMLILQSITSDDDHPTTTAYPPIDDVVEEACEASLALR